MRIDEKTRLERRRAALDQERQSWLAHWRELADYVLPRRVRFLSSERNRGDKINQKILDATGTLAARTLASGMMSGITSPARPWFRLVTRDRQSQESAEVKTWLWQAEAQIRQLFAASNLYNAVHTLYEDLAVFGTAAMIVEPDESRDLRGYSLPLGSYWLAASDGLSVDTLFREVPMTTGRMVERFGQAAVSQAVHAAYESGNLDAWWTVYQAIEPNPNAQPDDRGRPGKAWVSRYWEAGGEGLLAEAGYEQKPFLAPRWHVTGVDLYGRSPGMDALADIKQLQVEQRRKGQAIDKMVNPPLQGPSSLQSQAVSLLPGAKTFVAPADLQAGGLRPVYEVRPNLGELMADIIEVQGRIRSAFYADLFLMLAGSDRRQITATEVEERRSEKMLALGPVLERLQDELVNPLVDLAFARVVGLDRLPPPPEVLQGQDLRVELQSMLAREQRVDAVVGLDRLLSVVAGLAAAAPEVLDKIDADQVVDEYAELTGAPPRVLRGEAEVVQRRRARDQSLQAAQLAQGLQAGVETAKTANQVKPEAGSLLAGLLEGSAP
ncbi:MAG: portal protein [Rhodospirillales bacterium]